MSEEKYIVIATDEDGHNAFPTIETAREIISTIDMFDCYHSAIYKVYKVHDNGELEELTIKGCWHDFNNPLSIKLLDSRGNVEISGYGTDH
jgi:hypothetical protein